MSTHQTPGGETERHRILKQFGWWFVPFHYDFYDKEIPDHWESSEHEGNFTEEEALALVAKELEDDHEHQLKEDRDSYWNDPDYH